MNDLEIMWALQGASDIQTEVVFLVCFRDMWGRDISPCVRTVKNAPFLVTWHSHCSQLAYKCSTLLHWAPRSVARGRVQRVERRGVPKGQFSLLAYACQTRNP